LILNIKRILNLKKITMKKFLKFAFVAIFVATAGYGVYASQRAEAMSDLALANVEALADPETSSDCVKKDGSQCWALVVTPNGSYSEVYFDQTPRS
jgi:hypothetical protein